MSLHENIGDFELPVLLQAPRAVAMLTVPWSTPERIARLEFQRAAQQMTAQHLTLDVKFFTVDEEPEWSQSWLHGLNVTQLGEGFPLGAGSMLWLEFGRPVSTVVGGSSLKAKDIVDGSVWLWENHG